MTRPLWPLYLLGAAVVGLWGYGAATKGGGASEPVSNVRSWVSVTPAAGASLASVAEFAPGGPRVLTGQPLVSTPPVGGARNRQSFFGAPRRSRCGADMAWGSRSLLVATNPRCEGPRHRRTGDDYGPLAPPRGSREGGILSQLDRIARSSERPTSAAEKDSANV